ncbi:hypothetical protein P4H61_06790 [Paenibacillus peoriae]|uniref:hypothetical protein n=1 Tax=Paenibacillus peoriae TaxID=59893 RepID=UPI0004948CBE|nr:hypothetical protein [Paenibacillus peoriae]MEC0181204.1 hypothetical protein [Paenibacillus peoriae]
MKNLLKTVSSLCLVFSLLVGFSPATTYANKVDNESHMPFSKSVVNPDVSFGKPSTSITDATYDNPSSTVNFCYDEGQSTSSTIEPLRTCTGNAGTVRLVYTAGDRWDTGLIFWSVDPKFSFFYHFEGTIEFTNADNGGYVTDWNITATNVAGLPVSDTFYPKLRPGRYEARISGLAWDTNRQFSRVVPNCDITFTVY